jgi:manganese-dependent ADP-ribose/CDP-alcohol diphosphatase
MQRISFALLLVIFSVANSFGQQSRAVRIGILTDNQYCNCPDNGKRFYRSSLAKLDNCISAFNSLKLDAVFNLGDLIDHDYGSYDSVLTRYGKIRAPFYIALGNHDYMIKKSYRPGLMDRLGMKAGYYTVALGNWTMVVLNGDDLSYVAPQNKSQKKERNDLVTDLYSGLHFNGMIWNGGIGQVQMNWIREQLEAAQNAGKKVIVLCHFPLYSKEDHNLFNNKELFALLQEFTCVKAYFCGHYHAGDYKEKKGIHLVNFKGMVDTHMNAYSVVTLTNDSILIHGYGRETSRRLGIR